LDLRIKISGYVSDGASTEKVKSVGNLEFYSRQWRKRVLVRWGKNTFVPSPPKIVEFKVEIKRMNIL